MQKEQNVNLSYLNVLEKSVYNEFQKEFIEMNKKMDDLFSRITIGSTATFWDKFFGGGAALFTTLVNGFRDTVVDFIFGIGQAANRIGHSVVEAVREKDFYVIGHAFLDSAADIFAGVATNLTGIAADVGAVFGASTDWAYGQYGVLDAIDHAQREFRGLYKGKTEKGGFVPRNSFSSYEDTRGYDVEKPEVARASYENESFEKWTYKINDWQNTTRDIAGYFNINFIKGQHYENLVTAAASGDKSAENVLNVTSMIGDISGRMVSSALISKGTKAISSKLGISTEAANSIARIVGKTVFTTSIFASSFNRALNNGSSIQDAYVYATGHAMQSFLIDKLTLSNTGLMGKLHGKISEGIDSLLARNFLKAVTSATQKSTGMVLRGYSSNALESYAHPDKEFSDFQRTRKDIIEQTWQTFLISFIMDTVTEYTRENKISKTTPREEIRNVKKEYEKMIKSGDNEKATEVVMDLITRLNDPKLRGFDGKIMSRQDRLDLIRQLHLDSFVIEKDATLFEALSQDKQTQKEFLKQDFVDAFHFDAERFEFQLSSAVHNGKQISPEEYAINRAVLGEINLGKDRELVLRSEVDKKVLDLLDNRKVPTVLYRGKNEDGFYVKGKTALGQEFVAININSAEYVQSGDFGKKIFMHETAHFIVNNMNTKDAVKWVDTIIELENEKMLPEELLKTFNEFKDQIVKRAVSEIGVFDTETYEDMIALIRKYDTENNTRIEDRVVSEIASEYIAYTFENFGDEKLQLAFSGTKENWFSKFLNIFKKDNSLEFFKKGLVKPDKQAEKKVQGLYQEFIRESYNVTRKYNTIQTILKNMNYKNYSFWNMVNNGLINKEIVKNHDPFEIANAFVHLKLVNRYESEVKGNNFLISPERKHYIQIGKKFYPIEEVFSNSMYNHERGMEIYSSFINEFYNIEKPIVEHGFETRYSSGSIGAGGSNAVQNQELSFAFRRVVSKPNFDTMVDNFEIQENKVITYENRLDRVIEEVSIKGGNIKPYRDLLAKITEQGTKSLNDVEKTLLKKVMVQKKYEEDLKVYNDTVSNANEVIAERATEALTTKLIRYMNTNLGLFNDFKQEKDRTQPSLNNTQAVMTGTLPDLYKEFDPLLKRDYKSDIESALDFSFSLLPELKEDYDIDVQISGEDYKITVSPNENAFYRQIRLTEKRNHIAYGIQDSELKDITKHTLNKSSEIMSKYGTYSTNRVMYVKDKPASEYVDEINSALTNSDVVVAVLPSDWRANYKLHNQLPDNVRVVEAYTDRRLSKDERITTMVFTTSPEINPTANYRVRLKDTRGVEGMFKFVSFGEDYDIKIATRTIMDDDYYLKGENMPVKEGKDRYDAYYIKTENEKAHSILEEIDYNDLLLRSSSGKNLRIAKEDIVMAYLDKAKEMAGAEDKLFRKKKEKEVSFTSELKENERKRDLLRKAFLGENYIIDTYMEKDTNGNYYFRYKNIFVNDTDKYKKLKASIKIPTGLMDKDGKEIVKEFSNEDYAIHLYNGDYVFDGAKGQSHIKNIVENYGLVKIKDLSETEKTIHEEILSKTKLNYVVVEKPVGSLGFVTAVVPSVEDAAPVLFITRKGLEKASKSVVKTAIHEQTHLLFADIPDSDKGLDRFLSFIDAIVGVVFHDKKLSGPFKKIAGDNFEEYLFTGYKRNITQFRQLYEHIYGKSFRFSSTPEGKATDLYRIIAESKKYLEEQGKDILGNKKLSKNEKRRELKTVMSNLDFLNEAMAQFFGYVFSDVNSVREVFFYDVSVFDERNIMANKLIDLMPKDSAHTKLFEKAIKEAHKSFLERAKAAHGTSIEEEKATGKKIPKELHLPQINKWIKEYTGGEYKDIRDLIADAAKNFAGGYNGRGRRYLSEIIRTLADIPNKTKEQQDAFDYFKQVHMSFLQLGEKLATDDKFLKDVKNIYRFKENFEKVKDRIEKADKNPITAEGWEKYKKDFGSLVDVLHNQFDVLSDGLESPEEFVDFLNTLNVTVSKQQEVEKVSKEIQNKFELALEKLQEFVIDMDNVDIEGAAGADRNRYKLQDLFNNHKDLVLHFNALTDFFDAFENSPLGTNVLKSILINRAKVLDSQTKKATNGLIDGFKEIKKHLYNRSDKKDYGKLHKPTIETGDFINQLDDILRNRDNIKPKKLVEDTETLFKDFSTEYFKTGIQRTDIKNEQDTVEEKFAHFGLSDKEKEGLYEKTNLYREGLDGLLNLATFMEQLLNFPKDTLLKQVKNGLKANKTRPTIEPIPKKPIGENFIDKNNFTKDIKKFVGDIVKARIPVQKGFNTDMPISMAHKLVNFSFEHLDRYSEGKKMDKTANMKFGGKIRKLRYKFVGPSNIFEQLSTTGVPFLDNLSEQFYDLVHIKTEHEKMYNELLGQVAKIVGKNGLSKKITINFDKFLQTDSALEREVEKRVTEKLKEQQKEIDLLQEEVNKLELKQKTLNDNEEKRKNRVAISQAKKAVQDKKKEHRKFSKTTLERLSRIEIVNESGEADEKKHSVDMTYDMAMLIYALANNMIESDSPYMNFGKSLFLQDKPGDKIQKARKIILNTGSPEEIIEILDEQLFNIPGLREVYDLIFNFKEERGVDLKNFIFEESGLEIKLVGGHYAPYVFEIGKKVDVLTLASSAFDDFATSFGRINVRENTSGKSLFVRNGILNDTRLILHSIFRMKINSMTQEWLKVLGDNKLKRLIEEQFPDLIDFIDRILLRTLGYTDYRKENSFLLNMGHKAKIAVSPLPITILSPLNAIHMATAFYRRTGKSLNRTKLTALVTAKNLYRTEEDNALVKEILKNPILSAIIERSGDPLMTTVTGTIRRSHLDLSYSGIRRTNTTILMLMVREYEKNGRSRVEAIKATAMDAMSEIVNGIPDLRNQAMHGKTFEKFLLHMYSTIAHKNFGRVLNGNMFNTSHEIEDLKNRYDNYKKKQREKGEKASNNSSYWGRRSGSSIDQDNYWKDEITGEKVSGKKYVSYSAIGLATSFILTALIQSLQKVIVGKRTKDEFWTDALINELLLKNILGTIPYMNIITGNVYFKGSFRVSQGVRLPVYQELISIMDAMNRLVQGKATARDYINMGTNIGTLFGLPTKNMVDLFKGVAHLAGLTGNNTAMEVSAFLTGHTKTKQLTDALQAGHTKKAQSLMGEMFTDDAIYKEIMRIISRDGNAKISFYSNLHSFTKVENERAKVYQIPTTIRSKYTVLIERGIRSLISSGKYKSIKTEAEKAKAIQRIVNYYYNLMKKETLSGRVGKYDNPREVVERSLNHYWNNEKKRRTV